MHLIFLYYTNLRRCNSYDVTLNVNRSLFMHWYKEDERLYVRCLVGSSRKRSASILSDVEGMISKYVF